MGQVMRNGLIQFRIWAWWKIYRLAFKVDCWASRHYHAAARIDLKHPLNSPVPDEPAKDRHIDGYNF